MIVQLLIRRVRDIDVLYQAIKSENVPELKLVWEYQINLNMEIIDALMRHDLTIASAYTNEIVRSTKAAEMYRASLPRGE